MSIRALACGPAVAPIGVWRIDLDAVEAPPDSGVLDADERARADRFAFPWLASRYRHAHTALRVLLAQQLDADPAGLRYARGPQGKPRLTDMTCPPEFNLSDSDDLALIAIAPVGEIGVDVERLREVPDATELAALHFGSREAGWLAEAKSSLERDLRFLRVWTRKEACLKAIGSGLSIPAASFDAGLCGDAPQFQAWHPVAIDTPDGRAALEVIEIDAGADCVAALARRIGRKGRAA